MIIKLHAINGYLSEILKSLFFALYKGCTACFTGEYSDRLRSTKNVVWKAPVDALSPGWGHLPGEVGSGSPKPQEECGGRKTWTLNKYSLLIKGTG